MRTNRTIPRAHLTWPNAGRRAAVIIYLHALIALAWVVAR